MKLTDMTRDLRTLSYNQSAIQNYVIDLMERSMVEGEVVEIMDPNNPVIATIESAVALGCNTINSVETMLKRFTTNMATSMEELYPHMSDEDYMDRFSQPAEQPFKLYIGKDEIKNKAMPLESQGTRRLIIPRDTEITYADLNFTLQYPIVISILPHGGYKVLYDTNETSPIKTPGSNMLDWEMVKANFNGLSLDGLLITIPFMQYRISTFEETIVDGMGFKEVFSFADQFFYARVWNRTKKGWVELKSTHDALIYDPYHATAVFKVVEGKLHVYIPEIYLSTGQIKGDLRIDIYTTRGHVEKSLDGFVGSEISVRYRDLNGYSPAGLVTPLQTFSSMQWSTGGILSGGRNALSFEELRRRVTDNAVGSRLLPISENQLENYLEDRGIEVAKSIDFVTDRTYLASIEMPASTIMDLTAPLGTLNGIMDITLAELAMMPTVRSNGQRMTVLPDTIYEAVYGKIRLNTDVTLAKLRQKTTNELIATMNSRQFAFSPFYYVYDINGESFETRVYDLANPTISLREFRETNETLGIDVGTDLFTLEWVNGSYRFRISTRSDKAYKDLDDSKVFAQISFSPRGLETEYAYLDGTEVNRTKEGERVFEFTLTTEFDVDKNHDLILTNFTLLGGAASEIGIPLVANVNVILGVIDYVTPNFLPSNIDKILDTSELGKTALGLTHESYRFSLGSHLPHLWSNARTLMGGMDYMRYHEDIPAVWPVNVYRRDPVTGSAIVKMVNGKPKLDLLHAAGTPVIKDGVQEIRHRKGSVVYGSDDKPIVLNPRKVARQVDLFLFDARYLISDTIECKAYVKATTNRLLEYALDKIPEINQSLLEKTSMFLYPKTNMGLIEVQLGDNERVRIPAEISFRVKVYVSKAARRNAQLLNSISDTIRRIIMENLKLTTVSITKIEAEIDSIIKNEVVSIHIEGIGEESKDMMFTVIDPNSKPTIGKKMYALPDNTLGIRDDISIQWIVHELTA